MKPRIDYDDIVGNKYSRLTVTEFAGRNKRNRLMYRCICDCGNGVTVQRDCLLQGNTRSCGCIRGLQTPEDLIGSVYGKITVAEYIGKKTLANGKRGHFYRCHCECGNDVEISRRTLLSGRINECGSCARIVKENDYYRYICTNGESWIFDEQDLEFVKSRRWHINGRYPCSYIDYGQKAFHALVLGTGPGEYVDHINRDTLDNRRKNWRIATPLQNTQNRKLNATNTSGYKGVHFAKENGKYRAAIKANHKYKHLGYFVNPEDAARAYDEAARFYFGEFACLNFPLPGEQGCRENQSEEIAESA